MEVLYFVAFLGVAMVSLSLVGSHHGRGHPLTASSALQATLEGPEYLEVPGLYRAPNICVSIPFLRSRNSCANVGTPPPVAPRVVWRLA